MLLHTAEFLKTEWYAILFIPSSVDGHLGCFHILANVNGISISIEVLTALWGPDNNILSKYSELGLLNHMVVLFLIFEKLPYCFPFCFSINNVCCCSVAKSCSTLCDPMDPMDCSNLVFPVLPYLQGFAQTHDPEFAQAHASLMAQMAKNLPAMQETQVWSPGSGRSSEKGMATHSSILSWRIP